MKRNKLIWSITLLVSAGMVCTVQSCKKFVETDGPSNSINGSNVFASDATAAGVLTAFYANMSRGGTTLDFSTGYNSISIQAGLSADELTLWNGATAATLVAQYQNALSANTNPPFWNNFYSFIYKINDAIEGISASKDLTSSVKQQLLGEAKFLRGLCHFYLVNMYGDVPLTTTSDYAVNSTKQRTAKSTVLEQVIVDLNEAVGLLSDSYVDAGGVNPTTERVRPNKWAATALLARAYLYKGDWVNAEARSTSVITKTSLYDTVPLNSIFLKNSKEAIWQLQPVNKGWNTEDAKIFSLSSFPAGPSQNKFVYLSSSLVNSFEANDKRKTNWVGQYTDGTGTYYFPNKYKSATNGDPVTEYLMVLRLGEQYLIRAEARAQQDKIAESQADLNIIRKRAGLPNTTAIDKASLLTAILKERRIELFTEWGHRWFDLKRTGTIDAVMSTVTPAKGGSWSTNWQLYPIPLYDLQKNPKLVQNAGY